MTFKGMCLFQQKNSLMTAIAHTIDCINSKVGNTISIHMDLRITQDYPNLNEMKIEFSMQYRN